MEQFSWALSILWYPYPSYISIKINVDDDDDDDDDRSRAFAVKIDGEPKAALVPYACMFNTQINASHLKV